MELADRIKEVLLYSRMSIDEFAGRVAKTHVQTIKKILNGTTKALSYRTAGNILRAFPEIDSDWLLEGKGSMLHFSSPAVSININRSNSDGDDPILSEVVKIGDPDLVEKIDRKICSLKQEIDYLKGLIVEKDARIKVLESSVGDKQKIIDLLTPKP